MALPWPWLILFLTKKRQNCSILVELHRGPAPRGKRKRLHVPRERIGAGPPTPSSPANCYGTTLGDSKFTFKKKLASLHICKVKAQKAFYKPKPLFSRAYSFTN